MKYCQNCGKEIADDSIYCGGCGTRVAQPEPVSQPDPVAQAPKEDKVSVGLCILAFFVPLFGIIYWIVSAATGESPKAARACGITALVSWGVGIVCSILAFLLPYAIFALSALG